MAMAYDNSLIANPSMNVKGTTCKSFKVGKQKVSFASSSITRTKDFDYNKYKELSVVRGENGEYIVYDCSIPENAVKYITTTGSGENEVNKIVLYGGKTITLTNSSKAISWEDSVSANDGEDSKMIVVYDTTSGKFMRSVFNVMTEDDLNNITGGILNQTEDTILDKYQHFKDVAAAIDENSDTLEKRIPTMSAVASYVGSILDVLAARTDGSLKGDVSN